MSLQLIRSGRLLNVTIDRPLSMLSTGNFTTHLSLLVEF